MTIARRTAGGLATLAAALALVAWAPPGRARADDEVERLRAENARLSARVRELEAENAGLRARTGSVDAAADRSVTASPDPARKVTALAVGATRLELTGGNGSRHWITLRAEEGAGATPGGAAEIQIEAAASNGAYRSVDRLELTLDGAPLSLPVSRRTAIPIFAGPQQQRIGERETVYVAATAEAVARIGAAREVRGRLGPTTFELSGEQIASFAALSRRLGTPAAAAP